MILLIKVLPYTHFYLSEIPLLAPGNVPARLSCKLNKNVIRREESAVLSGFCYSGFRALGSSVNACLVTNSFVKLVALLCGLQRLFTSCSF